MNADQVNSTTREIESNLRNDAYDAAEKDLNLTIEALDQEEALLAAIGASTSIRLVRALIQIAEYQDLVNGSETETTYENAERLLKRANALYAQDPSLIYEQGLLFFSRSQYDKALSEFKRVIDLGGTHQVADLELAFQWASAASRRLFRISDAEQIVESLCSQQSRPLSYFDDESVSATRAIGSLIR